MKVWGEVHADKLRGGFYTAPHVVDFCLGRIKKLAGRWPDAWLEPSSGDGAFLRGIARALGKRAAHARLEAVELAGSEAAKCRAVLCSEQLRGRVVHGSFFDWAASTSSRFDAVVGNPPFVRYQFVDDDERTVAEQLIASLGIVLRGVSNLWIPFALLSLDRLRIGGCFAMVLPSELFCTVSGGQFRSYLVQNFAAIQLDLFPRDTFPDLTQDVVVVSGRRTKAAIAVRPIAFVEHRSRGSITWKHQVPASEDPWLRYLLTEEEHEAFVLAQAASSFRKLGEVARIEVAIVTGANAYFTVTDEIVSTYDLGRWTVPLLARTADSPGVIFTSEDHAQARSSGSRGWLLDFSERRPKPNGRGPVSRYLALGEHQGIPARYKCRIRDPWYRVPHIRRGSLMMTKRAHHHHRLLLNQAGVFTTDTIYRGEMREPFAGREKDLAAVFQNTLTLLSSEVEGRTYGGGVLELVPSEIARLMVPILDCSGLLDHVDRVSREVGGQRDCSGAVTQIADEFLCERMPLYRQLLPLLDSGRRRLVARRQDTTNHGAQPGLLD